MNEIKNLEYALRALNKVSIEQRLYARRKLKSDGSSDWIIIEVVRKKGDTRSRTPSSKEKVLLNQAYLEKIKNSLEEYQKHKNDPFAYYQEEIEAVRNLKSDTPEFISFLLQNFPQNS